MTRKYTLHGSGHLVPDRCQSSALRIHLGPASNQDVGSVAQDLAF